MHDAGFERLEELFHAALALPVGERSAFLRAQCGDDAALREEVEGLLAADGGVLDVPVLEQLGGDDLEGQTAGRWRIGKRIGEGGLGVVYEAREDGGTRRAAIKFLRPGFDAGSFRRRFLKERRILGELEHPHIARWLDGGVDEAGRPYLVMEFVDGQPLDRYMAETRPGGTARLDLLTQVCDAVQYLHGALVAHGDLKPSNILVGADGQVKLLDFGAAKLIMPNDSTGGGETTMTRAFLTPHYASPEQKMGEGPSVSSDIYALGVILGEAFPAADRDLLAIRDLCCRAEVRERDRSVLELGQDLQRYKAKQPVRARRQDLKYKTGKFLQRHVVAVGLSAAVMAGAGTAGYFQWREVQRDRERLAQMRTVVRSVLQNGPTQVVNAGEDRKAMRTTMESAIREVEASGEKGMELDMAAAWRRVGAARLEEGNTDGGVDALKKASELAEQVWRTKGDPAALESKAVSLPLWALALQARRDSEDGIAVARKAVALHAEYKRVFGRPLGPANPYYRLILQLGPALAKRGEMEEGRGLLLEALAMARQVKSTEYTGRALVELAALEGKDGKDAAAKGYCDEAGRVAPLTRKLREVCGSEAPAAMTEDEQIATMRAQIRAKVEEIRHDPERFPALRRLAGMHQQLGMLLHEKGRDAEARVEVERAAEYLDEMVKKDPQSVPLKKQARRARLQLELLSK